MKQTIIFVCEHGAAKSIVAAAYFNKLAMERNIPLLAIARGTTPDVELLPKAVDGLRVDGLTSIESIPRKLSLMDVESAARIVTFCELPEEDRGTVEVEHWEGVPPVSDNYDKARDVIVEKLNRLMNSL